MSSREERRYIVWGILIAGFFGFLINIFASLYYGFFITNDLTWQRVDHLQFIVCIASFLGIIGYLKFFVNDYPNSPEISKEYGKKFLNFFFYQFGPGKALRVIMGIYLLLLLISILILFYYVFAKFLGYYFANIMVCAAFILANIKEIIKKRRNA